ncbi:MAG: hypothetical protein H0U67_04425 [Gemmatimonadetes bacterium]|nr:hypothetical protein [Gemmatimonadota bacterium]
MSTTIPNHLVSDIARDVVQQVAPRELPLFAATSRAYFEQPDRLMRRNAGDRTLGFGPEFAIALTPVILMVVKATIELLSTILQDALKAEGTTAATDALRRLFRRGAAEPPPPVTGTG